MVAALFSKVDINKFHAQIEQDSMLERAFSDAALKERFYSENMHLSMAAIKIFPGWVFAGIW